MQKCNLIICFKVCLICKVDYHRFVENFTFRSQRFFGISYFTDIIRLVQFAIMLSIISSVIFFIPESSMNLFFLFFNILITNNFQQFYLSCFGKSLFHIQLCRSIFTLHIRCLTLCLVSLELFFLWSTSGCLGNLVSFLTFQPLLFQVIVEYHYKSFQFQFYNTSLIRNNPENSAWITPPLPRSNLRSVSTFLSYKCFHFSPVNFCTTPIHFFNDLFDLVASALQLSRVQFYFFSSPLLSAISNSSA